MQGSDDALCLDVCVCDAERDYLYVVVNHTSRVFYSFTGPKEKLGRQRLGSGREGGSEELSLAVSPLPLDSTFVTIIK